MGSSSSAEATCFRVGVAATSGAARPDAVRVGVADPVAERTVSGAWSAPEPARRTEGSSQMAALEASEVGIEMQELKDSRASEPSKDLFVHQWLAMFTYSQLIGMVLGVGLWITLQFVELDEAYPKANDMLATTALVACFWAFEVLPLEVTSLFPIALMPFSEIDSSKAVSVSYWNWVQMMFLGAFLVDIAIKHVGLHRRLALMILLKVGVARPWAILLAFMSVAFFLSMWCSNTATAIMLIPYATFLLDTAVSKDTSGTLKEEQRHSFSKGVFLAIAYSATSGGIATSIGTPPNGVLLGQDILSGEVSAALWLAFAFPLAAMLFAIVYVVIYCLTMRGIQLSLDEGQLREEYEALGPIDRDETIVLFTQVLQIVGWLLRPDVINDALGLITVNDATIACAAAVIPFFMPSCRRGGESIVTWEAAQAGVPWGVLLLMGGGFALAKGFETSKLTLWIGQQLKEAAGMGKLPLTFLIVTCVCFTTEVTSNTATANIILPIFASVSVKALVHPLALMVPATCACSFAFMLPAATPPNLVVFATRRVRMRDFVIPGLIINVFAILLGSPVIYLMARATFDIEAPFPKWACDASDACHWLTGQACADTDVEGLCRLSDGSLLNVTGSR